MQSEACADNRDHRSRVAAAAVGPATTFGTTSTAEEASNSQPRIKTKGKPADVMAKANKDRKTNFRSQRLERASRTATLNSL